MRYEDRDASGVRAGREDAVASKRITRSGRVSLDHSVLYFGSPDYLEGLMNLRSGLCILKSSFIFRAASWESDPVLLTSMEKRIELVA